MIDQTHPVRTARRLRRWASLLVPLFLLATSIGAASAQSGRTVISRSGQFVIFRDDEAVQRRTSAILRVPQPGAGPIELTPETLTISCERVKTEILRLLNQPDRWRRGSEGTGKINIAIDPRVRTNAPLIVATAPYENGWKFHIGLPPAVPEDQFVRVLVQAILTELASRNGNSRSGEPPLWLVEGVTQIVLADAPVRILSQPDTGLVADMRLGERFGRVRTRLARGAPLMFHELSHPDLSRMEARQWDMFSACAHLLVRELARMPDGPSRLATWLSNLQSHWNWQSGFIEAFEPAFRSLLDTEKWWAVTLANFAGRTANQVWPVEFSLRKLNEALQPVSILPSAGNRTARMTLEEVIQNWDFARQIPVLHQFLQQLQALSFNSSPEVRTVVLQYADAIDAYLDARRRVGYEPTGRGQLTPTSRSVSRDAVARLRELDGIRRKLEENPPASPAEDNEDSDPNSDRARL